MVGDTADVGLEVAYWLPLVKTERGGWSSPSTSSSEMTIGRDCGELETLSGSGEEAESQFLGSTTREGDGGGG